MSSKKEIPVYNKGEKKRTFRYEIKLNKEEYDAFNLKLEQSIYKKMPQMIRSIVINNEYKMITVDKNLTQEKAVLITEIKKIGSNFNQLVKLLNTKKLNYFTQNDILNIKTALTSIKLFYESIKNDIK